MEVKPAILFLTGTKTRPVLAGAMLYGSYPVNAGRKTHHNTRRTIAIA
jgi:hypothetical protein